MKTLRSIRAGLAAIAVTGMLLATGADAHYYPYYDYYNWGYDNDLYDDDWFYDYYEYDYDDDWWYDDGYYNYGYDWDLDLFDWEEDGLFE